MEDREILQDIPAGVTIDRALVFSPPKTSICSNWINAAQASNTIMQGTVDAGAILDLDIELTFLTANLVGHTQAVTTATLGNVYYLALDGKASNKLVPRGLPSTT